jgi:hypothetical protein
LETVGDAVDLATGAGDLAAGAVALATTALLVAFAAFGDNFGYLGLGFSSSSSSSSSSQGNLYLGFSLPAFAPAAGGGVLGATFTASGTVNLPTVSDWPAPC